MVAPFTKSFPCPVCGGHRGLPQGQGVRCHGYLSSDQQYAHCARPEFAGTLREHASTGLYAHRLEASCRCGVKHGDAVPASPQHAMSGADEPKPWSFADSDIELHHPYREPNGSLAFEVVRFLPHARRPGVPKVLPRHRGADGRWYLGQGRWKSRSDKPLYRQAEAIDELRLGGTVFLVEGERDADALWDRGLIAVCCPDGCRGFRKHHADILAEALTDGDDADESRHPSIVIVADNDTDGIAAARSVWHLLTKQNPGLSQQIALKVPPEGINDVTDFLAAGGFV